MAGKITMLIQEHAHKYLRILMVRDSSHRIIPNSKHLEDSYLHVDENPQVV